MSSIKSISTEVLIIGICIRISSFHYHYEVDIINNEEPNDITVDELLKITKRKLHNISKKFSTLYQN